MKPIPWKWKVFAFVTIILCLLTSLYVIYLIVQIWGMGTSMSNEIRRPYFVRAFLKELAVVFFLTCSAQLFFKYVWHNKIWKPSNVWQFVFYCLCALLIIFELQNYWIVLEPFIAKGSEAIILSKSSEAAILIRTIHLALIVYQLIYSNSLLQLSLKEHQKIEADTIHQIGQ
jgi:hypothetical protein